MVSLEVRFCYRQEKILVSSSCLATKYIFFGSSFDHIAHLLGQISSSPCSLDQQGWLWKDLYIQEKGK